MGRNLGDELLGKEMGMAMTTGVAPATPETLSRRLGPVPGGATLTRRERQQLFLDGYRNSRNIRASCMKAGISRATLYRWRESVKGFAALMVEAELDYCDALRALVDERAKTSDQVLMMRAKAVLPEYKETIRTEHVLPAELPVRFSLQFTAPMPDAEEG